MTDADLLISRAVDRQADLDDWHALEGLARTDGDLWRRLAATLHDDARLRLAVQDRLAPAARVELPGSGRRTAALPRGRAWTGWAAALLVGLAWWGSAARDPAPAPAAPPPATAAAAQVLYELPRILLETRPTDDGDALEVLYLRRAIEREVVTGVYELGQDELGRPTPVPVDPHTLSVSELL